MTNISDDFEKWFENYKNSFKDKHSANVVSLNRGSYHVAFRGCANLYAERLRVAVEALEGVKICLGYAPDHCGESYEFVLNAIEELREHADEALKKIRGEV